MNKEHLLDKQKQATDKFDTLAQEREQLQKRLDVISVEQVKLQGEHLGYQTLLDELGPEDKNTPAFVKVEEAK